MKNKIVKCIVLSLSLLVFNTGFASNFLDGVDAYDKKNYQQAKKIWLDLAKLGHKQAQYNLAVLFDSDYIKNENNQAFVWYQRSAKLGYAPAQYQLGRIYYFGFGVPEDNQKALKWWQAAAKQNLIEAQYNLGILFLSKDKKKQNLKQAKIWFSKAEVGGHLGAKQILDKLTKDNPKLELSHNKLEKVIVPKIEKIATPKKNVVVPILVVKDSIAVINNKKNDKETIVLTVEVDKKIEKMTSTQKELGLVKIKKSKQVEPRLIIKKNWLDQQDKNYYTVQLIVADSQKSAYRFIKKHHLEGQAHSYKIKRKRLYKVILGSYSSRKQAQVKIRMLSKALKRYKPWPKKFSVVQAERAY